MKDLLFFDAETTGIPAWKEKSEAECQPHIVQLAAIRVDQDTQEVKQSIDVIIKPEGWVIPDETIEINGITQDYALKNGVSERTVLEMFLALNHNCEKRIAYNTTFDNRIIRIGLKRYFNDETNEIWKAGNYECAMMLSQKVMTGKRPKLTAAYEFFTGSELINAHSAMADTIAAKDVYFAAKDRLNLGL